MSQLPEREHQARQRRTPYRQKARNSRDYGRGRLAHIQLQIYLLRPGKMTTLWQHRYLHHPKQQHPQSLQQPNLRRHRYQLPRHVHPRPMKQTFPRPKLLISQPQLRKFLILIARFHPHIRRNPKTSVLLHHHRLHLSLPKFLA